MIAGFNQAQTATINGKPADFAAGRAEIVRHMEVRTMRRGARDNLLSIFVIQALADCCSLYDIVILHLAMTATFPAPPPSSPRSVSSRTLSPAPTKRRRQLLLRSRPPLCTRPPSKLQERRPRRGRPRPRRWLQRLSRSTWPWRHSTWHRSVHVGSTVDAIQVQVALHVGLHFC